MNDDKVTDESNDKNIQPNEELIGYQDDLASGEQEDVASYEQSREQDDTPAQLTGMPEPVIKEELDMLAIDEPGHDSQRDEDRREHIEDMDENDKEH